MLRVWLGECVLSVCVEYVWREWEEMERDAECVECGWRESVQKRDIECGWGSVVCDVFGDVFGGV